MTHRPRPKPGEALRPKAERRASLRAVMGIPASIVASRGRVQRFPCLVDPDCTIDHLRRKA